MHTSSNLRICCLLTSSFEAIKFTYSRNTYLQDFGIMLKKVQFKVVDSRLCDCSFAYQVK